MIKTSLVATALCLAFSAAMAATPDSGSKSQTNAIKKCEGLTGAALDQCKREAAPGKSEDAASRAGGASPGASGDATSRTGTPPGKSDTIEKGKK
jgi:hypothetical protein